MLCQKRWVIMAPPSECFNFIWLFWKRREKWHRMTNFHTSLTKFTHKWDILPCGRSWSESDMPCQDPNVSLTQRFSHRVSAVVFGPELMSWDVWVQLCHQQGAVLFSNPKGHLEHPPKGQTAPSHSCKQDGCNIQEEHREQRPGFNLKPTVAST